MDKDAYNRLNYLYQLANFSKDVNPFLSIHYMKEMISVCEKKVIRK